MKRFLFASLILVVLSCHPEKKGGQENIITTKTAKHLNILGTKLYVVPKKGFRQEPYTTNMEKVNAALIQFIEMEGSNYYKNAQVSTREELETKGCKVISFRTLKLNEYEARTSHFSDGTDIWKMGVLFGDSSFTVMVMAFYDHNIPGLENDVEAILNSIYYDKNKKVNPQDIAFFSVDETKSRFKYARLVAGMFLYAIDGLVKATYVEEPTILISLPSYDKDLSLEAVSDDQLKLARTHSGYTDIRVRNRYSTEINGKQAYVVDADVKINGQDALLHETVIKGNKKIVVAQASIKSDYEATLKEVKKLEETLRIKE